MAQDQQQQNSGSKGGSKLYNREEDKRSKIVYGLSQEKKLENPKVVQAITKGQGDSRNTPK